MDTVMRWSAPSGVIVPPEAIERLRSWCNLTDDNTVADRDLLDMLLHAMGVVEKYQRRQLLTATYAVYFDDWPADGTIVINDKLPIASIVSVQYVDTAGDTQTVTSTNYNASIVSQDSPARIIPIEGYSWPQLETGSPDRVIVNLTAGYGDLNSVPDTTKAALKWLVAQQVEHREPVLVGATVAELPFTVKTALDLECWGWYA